MKPRPAPKANYNTYPIGERVKTPGGTGTVIEPLGPHKKGFILVRLDKMIQFHHNWYYSPNELIVFDKKEKGYTAKEK